MREVFSQGTNCVIEVSCAVRAFPEISEGHTGINSIIVKNHWNDHDKIVVLVEGCAVTVLAKDLIAAVANATNTGKF